MVQDICRLFIKWKEATFGKDDGRELFQRLQEHVDRYTTGITVQQRRKPFYSGMKLQAQKTLTLKQTYHLPNAKGEKSVYITNH